MRIILAALTLILALALLPSSGIPVTGSMKRMQNAADGSLQRSGKKINPSVNNSTKPGKK